MEEAYHEVQEEHMLEYGMDAYNGHLNNCDFKKDYTDEYNKADDK